MKAIANGVWPTMVTPFDKDLKIDYGAAAAISQWYVENGASGLFAVCQSSEMFYLTLDERIKLAKTVANAVKKPVIASGHISDVIEDQIKEINEMAGTGAEAVVLVTNRLAKPDESDDVWKSNLEHLIENIPDEISLGFYECPYPYKRMLSYELIGWCAKTGRFMFYKDTSCSTAVMEERLKAAEGTGFKIFNANSATLLETLQIGVSGYSGVMANFHPDLYAWLCSNWDKSPEDAEILSDYLALASCIEARNYPKCAKYAMKSLGLPIDVYCRKESEDLSESFAKEVTHMMKLDALAREKLNL